jgi:hypothetical protein
MLDHLIFHWVGYGRCVKSSSNTKPYFWYTYFDELIIWLIPAYVTSHNTKITKVEASITDKIREFAFV